MYIGVSDSSVKVEVCNIQPSIPTARKYEHGEDSRCKLSSVCEVCEAVGRLWGGSRARPCRHLARNPRDDA